jgi:hypothetical protein
MEDIFLTAFRGSDHGAVLSAVAYLDHALELLLRASFRPLTSDEESRMFDGSANAVLGTTSNKIRTAYAMKLLESGTYQDLLRMNDIRNAFAHSLHNVTFDTPEIAADCNQFEIPFNPISLVGEPKTPKERFFHVALRAYFHVASDTRRMASPAKEEGGA